jgi:hypothetical protein
VEANVRKRLAVNKHRSHRCNVERFNLKELNKVEGKEQYRVEVSDRFQLWNIWTLRLILIVLGETTRGSQKVSGNL